MFAVGEQGIARSLDEGAVLGGEAAVLTTTDFIERVTEVAHEVDHLEVLDRTVVEALRLGHRLVGHLAAARACIAKR